MAASSLLVDAQSPVAKARTLVSRQLNSLIMDSFLTVLLVDVQDALNGPHIVGALRRRFLRSLLPSADSTRRWLWQSQHTSLHNNTSSNSSSHNDNTNSIHTTMSVAGVAANDLAAFFSSDQRADMCRKINADERLMAADLVIFYDDEGAVNGPAHLLAELLACDGWLDAGYLQLGIHDFAEKFPGICEMPGAPLPEKIEKLRIHQSELVQAVWYSQRSRTYDFPHVICPPFLYLGGQDAAQPHQLAIHQINHVIRIGFFNSFLDVADGSVDYHTYCLEDAEHEHIETIFDECVQIIDHARDTNGRVLVHCHAGVSRSATIVLVYLMQRMRMPLAEAFDFTFKQRPIIRPNEGFGRKLRQLETQIFSIPTSTMPLCWMSYDYGYYRQYLEFLICAEELKKSSTSSSSSSIISTSSTTSLTSSLTTSTNASLTTSYSISTTPFQQIEIIVLPPILTPTPTTKSFDSGFEEVSSESDNDEDHHPTLAPSAEGFDNSISLKDISTRTHRLTTSTHQHSFGLTVSLLTGAVAGCVQNTALASLTTEALEC